MHVTYKSLLTKYKLCFSLCSLNCSKSLKKQGIMQLDIFVDFSADNLLGKVPKLFHFWVSFTNLKSKGGKIEIIEIEN